MVSTKKNKQQNKRRCSQLTEGGTHFVIGQSNHEVRNGNIDSVVRRGPSSDNPSNLTQINYPQVVCMHLRKTSFAKYEMKRII